MIGRAAQGRPWIFREIDHYLRTGEVLAGPTWGELQALLLEHLDDHYRFYGELAGVRTARKHIGWYMAGLPGGREFTDQINRVESTAQQSRMLGDWLTAQASERADPFTTCDNPTHHDRSLLAA